MWHVTGTPVGSSTSLLMLTPPPSHPISLLTAPPLSSPLHPAPPLLTSHPQIPPPSVGPSKVLPYAPQPQDLPPPLT